MASILKSIDYALIWRKDKASTDNEPRLWEIRIFYKGQEALVRPLKKGANLTVVNNGDGTYLVKDVLLLRLAPTIAEDALAALLDQLGATIVDAYAPFGNRSSAPASRQRCTGDHRNDRQHPGGSNRRTGLRLSPGRRQPRNRGDRDITPPDG